MAQSASRTLTILATGSQFLQWEMADATDALDYYLDMSAVLAPTGDQISSAQVSCAPSGTGELTISTVSVDGDVVRMDLTGGVFGRVYRVRVDVGTLQGRSYSWLAILPIAMLGAVYAQPVAPNPQFGDAVSWFAMVMENAGGFWQLENGNGSWIWG